MKAATRVRTRAIAFGSLLAICVAVFSFASRATAGAAAQLSVFPGFKVTPIYSVPPDQGSWICMAADAKGRLLISPEILDRPGNTPFQPTLFRLTIRDQKISKIEKIQKEIEAPQGMLYAFDSLYVNGKGPDGQGIYRLRQRGEDDFEDPELLHSISYSGEHGSHALVLGPDNMIYVPSGNYVEHLLGRQNEISAASPVQHFRDDQLLRRYRDGTGLTGTMSGTVLRMDASGRDVQMFCAGTRNIYDIAFSPEGELFGFDNDQDFDWGTPWYRACRLLHLVSGGDYGFRDGTGKVPVYDEDVVPGVKDVSIGAPSGIKFGTGANFPEKYQRALFLLDWAYGRIFAAHLKPKGASYDCDLETIVHGTPLNVADLDVTPDGAMYFITGGRNTRSTLYQLEYTNSFAADEVQQSEATSNIRARAMRHQLEAFHGAQVWWAIDYAWPYLGDNDRSIRYAARLAIESQPVAKWKERASSETNRLTALTALLALARVGEKEVQPALLKAIGAFSFDTLSEPEALLKLRALEISFIRQSRPDAAVAKRIAAELQSNFPSASEPLTRELCRVLLYLGDSSAIGKILHLAQTTASRESQMFYLCCLSSISNGWTIEQRKSYFQLLGATSRPAPDAALVDLMNDAGIDYADGASFNRYLESFRAESVKGLSERERASLPDDLLHPPVSIIASTNKPFVRRWNMQDLASDLTATNRNIENGRMVFESSRCVACHRLKGVGGSIGPDLNALGKRATARDVLESIIEPSKVVADQYRNISLFMKSGEVYIGKIMETSASTVTLLIDAEKQRTVTVEKSDIQSQRISNVSPMPEGLVNHLTKDQILDLVAYLLSN